MSHIIINRGFYCWQLTLLLFNKFGSTLLWPMPCDKTILTYFCYSRCRRFSLSYLQKSPNSYSSTPSPLLQYMYKVFLSFFFVASETVDKNTCLALTAGTTAWQFIPQSMTSAAASDGAKWYVWRDPALSDSAEYIVSFAARLEVRKLNDSFKCSKNYDLINTMDCLYAYYKIALKHKECFYIDIFCWSFELGLSW